MVEVFNTTNEGDMTNTYLGVRVELASRFFTVSNLAARYNRKHKTTRVFDIHTNGRITVEKSKNMLIARGEDQSKDRPETGLVNFSIGVDMGEQVKEVQRVIQIVNVLGNDRLIKERVKTFVDGKSMLNSIPELHLLNDAFGNLEALMPGFIKAGWYYAPETIDK